MLDEIDRMIIEYYTKQKLSPIVMSKELNIDKKELVKRLRKLLEDGNISTSDGKEVNVNIKKKHQLNEIDKQILKYLENGDSMTKIAVKLGLTVQRISQRVKKMKERGIEIPNIPKKKRKTENDEIDNRILEGLAEGKTQTEIEKELGITVSSISYRIKKMKERGLEIPNKKEEIDNKILEGLAEGKTQTEIGKELGLTIPAISYRVKKMKERGIEIPNVPKKKIERPKKTENDETDEKIRKGLDEGKTLTKIAEELDLSVQRVSKRKHEMIKRDNKKLANMIVNLIITKNATIEQIKIMGAYYGVNVEEILNSLEEKER